MTFRSLPRPSSAISALAFTLCPYMLDLLPLPPSASFENYFPLLAHASQLPIAASLTLVDT